MTDSLRRAHVDDADALPDIERSAARLFAQDPELAWLVDAAVISGPEHRQHIATSPVWVVEAADGGIVGFLSAAVEGRQLHVQELSVGRSAQGQGLGRRLLQAAIEHARDQGLLAVTLTTFRELPWNEPFYRRCGFATLAAQQIDPHLQQRLDAEAAHGLPRHRRCAMRLDLRL